MYSIVVGGHLFLMFNMYVNSNTSFPEYVHTSKTIEWYVICIIYSTININIQLQHVNGVLQASLDNIQIVAKVCEVSFNFS